MNNYEKEMANRGKRYFRNQRIWEFVEGVVVTILFVICLFGVMAIW